MTASDTLSLNEEEEDGVVRMMAGGLLGEDENDKAHEQRSLSYEDEEYRSALDFLKSFHRYPKHSHSFPLDVIYEDDERRGCRINRDGSRVARSPPLRIHTLPRTRTAGSLVDLVGVADATPRPDSHPAPVRAPPPLSPDSLRGRKRTNEDGGDSGPGCGADEWGFFHDDDKPESIVVRRGSDLPRLALNSYHHATYSRSSGCGLKQHLRFDKKF
jgi:hypothetical protein